MEGKTVAWRECTRPSGLTSLASLYVMLVSYPFFHIYVLFVMISTCSFFFLRHALLLSVLFKLVLCHVFNNIMQYISTISALYQPLQVSVLTSNPYITSQSIDEALSTADQRSCNCLFLCKPFGIFRPWGKFHRKSIRSDDVPPSVYLYKVGKPFLGQCASSKLPMRTSKALSHYFFFFFAW